MPKGPGNTIGDAIDNIYGNTIKISQHIGIFPIMTLLKVCT